jgi:type I restriction enzyme S subunit
VIAGLKPYPAMKDSGVPWLEEVPEHWEIERLKSSVSNVVEQTAKRQSGDLYVALEHVEGWTGRLRPADSDVAFNSQVKRFRAGDVLFGKLRPYLAKVTRPTNGGVCVGEFLVLRPHGPGGSAPYIEQLLRSKPVIDALNSSTFGAKMPRADWQFLGGMPIPLPPLPEQHAIVRFLDHADRRIRRYIRAKQKLIKLLEEQKQAIIHRAVTRGLDPNVRLKPSGVEWLRDVPVHWEVWQIGHFAAVGNGSTPARGDARYWSGGTYPWLNSSSVNAGTIKSSDQFVTEVALSECHLPRVPSGSVLVAITGQGKTRGTAAVLLMEATINQHIAFITPRRRSETASPEYLQMFLSGAYSELRRMSDDSGSTKGALTCEDLRRFRVVLPPADEQREIVRRTHGATAEVEAALRLAEREMSLLREYRTRLIADVVTGKLDVREAAAHLPEDRDQQHDDDDEDVEEEHQNDRDDVADVDQQDDE